MNQSWCSFAKHNLFIITLLVFVVLQATYLIRTGFYDESNISRSIDALSAIRLEQTDDWDEYSSSYTWINFNQEIEHDPASFSEEPVLYVRATITLPSSTPCPLGQRICGQIYRAFLITTGTDADDAVLSSKSSQNSRLQVRKVLPDNPGQDQLKYGNGLSDDKEKPFAAANEPKLKYNIGIHLPYVCQQIDGTADREHINLQALGRKEIKFSLEMRVEYKSLEIALADPLVYRSMRFVGRPFEVIEVPITCFFSETGESLAPWFNEWFTHEPRANSTLDKSFDVNYEGKRDLNKCNSDMFRFWQSTPITFASDDKYSNIVKMQLLMVGDSQPRYECDFLVYKVLKATEKSGGHFLKLYQDNLNSTLIELDVQCSEKRAGSILSRPYWLVWFHDELERFMAVDSHGAQKKLLLNFAGLWETQEGKYYNEEKGIFQSRLSQLLALALKYVGAGNVVLMTTTLVHPFVYKDLINLPNHYVITEPRIQLLNKLSVEVASSDKFKDKVSIIDVWDASRIGEHDHKHDQDILHLSLAANRKLVNYLLCNLIYEYI